MVLRNIGRIVEKVAIKQNALHFFLYIGYVEGVVRAHRPFCFKTGVPFSMPMRIIRSLLDFSILAIFFLLAACSLHDDRTAGTDTGNPVMEITGQVLDLAGNPVANAQVALHSKEAVSPAQSLVRVATSVALPQFRTQTTTTDAQGYYRFESARSGRAYVVADLSDSLGRLDSLELSGDSAIVKNLSLQPKGALRVESGAYPVGTSIYIVQLNLTLTLGATALQQSVPPGHYQILILATGSDESTAQETTVQEKGTGLVAKADTTTKANRTRLAAWEFDVPAQPGLDSAAYALHAQAGEGAPAVASTSLLLDGTSGLRAPLASILQRNDFAIEARVYPTQFGALDNIITAEPPGNKGDGWVLRLENGKATVLLRDQETHGTQWQSIASSPLALNTWTVLRVERLGSSTRLWVNDTLAASQEIAGDIGQLEYDLGIGYDAMNQSLHDRYFSGQIDYLRILAIDSLTPPATTDTGITYGTLTDPRDLRTYKTVVIGTQTWMAQNLDFGTLDSATSTLQSGSVKYCHMNLQVNCATEGGLYQWHYAMGLPDSCATTYCSNLINLDKHQGICPDGWHMPDSADWDSLGIALGGLDVAGAAMKLNNTGYETFDDSLYNDGNSSGFSAYPVGIRYFDGEFKYHGEESNCNNTFWEAEEESTTLYVNAYRRSVNSLGPKLQREFNHAKADAFSIRCVKD
jgi:uncharacterized protein (TIGR02145 family)